MSIKISKINQNSIFKKYSISEGDKIVSINGREVFDFLGVIYETSFEKMVFKVKKKDGQIKEFEVEKNDYKKINVEFEESERRKCNNKCIFCFVDQNPEGLRKSLYFKDDDYRESFEYGNFITLSNLNEKLLKNIIEHKISPLYVSIHSVDNGLRKKIFGVENRIEKLEKLINGGIKIHGQVVLMRNINDGKYLEQTIKYSAQKKFLSLGIVPMGITKYRKDSSNFLPIDKEYSKNLITFVENLKEKLSYKKVYIADEFFLKAEEKIPPKSYYHSFPQYENGIGMVRNFIDETSELKNRKLKKGFAILTGKSFGEFLIKNNFFSSEGILPVVNRFFGEMVTVTGLLSGKDIVETMKNTEFKNYLIYKRVFNEDGLTLDNYTKKDIIKKSGKNFIILENSNDLVRYTE
ncbi:MAG: DUF512 domain-containing protein [candidate division WOR-3 bacterium]